MKKKLLAALSCIILNSFASHAQKVSKILCGDEIYRTQLNNKYPGFTEGVLKTFNATKAATNAARSTADEYTVNVVVHVIYKNEEENLHDTIINSQIDVLNEDFNRLNIDSVNTRTVFLPVVGRGRIHFNLAQIVRKSTTATFTPDLFSGGMPVDMKYDSLGGSSAVDPTHFINIWVCKIQPMMFGTIEMGQILGFAFPPNDISNWPAGSGAPEPGEDGVVIDFRCFGRNNPNPLTVSGQSVVIKGRTPVHEVGHYMGLRHIWGDGQDPFGGGNNCEGNDGIDDTPKADNQSSFDCDTTKNTCVDTMAYAINPDVPDMVEDYMDYSTETCMNMFSAGQVSHMRATLETFRSGLLEPLSVNTTKNLNLNVYPNPTKGELTISSVNNINVVNVYNLQGELMLLKNVSSTKTSLNLRSFSKGTYLITTEGVNGMKSKLIVVE